MGTMRRRRARWSCLFLCVLGVLCGQPFVAAVAAQPVERIVAIRVHGNYVAQEADVVALSGLVVGEPAAQATIDAAVDRVKRSGRFSDVTIQRRYASIADASQILLVIVV